MSKKQTTMEKLLNKYKEMIIDDFFHIGNDKDLFAFYLRENFDRMYEELKNTKNLSSYDSSDDYYLPERLELSRRWSGSSSINIDSD